MKIPKASTKVLEKFCKKCQQITTHHRYHYKHPANGRYYERDNCMPCYRAKSNLTSLIRRNGRIIGSGLLWAHRMKIRVFDMYGNKCACCGEMNLFFLDLDHVNNDGHLDKQRKGRVRRNKIGLGGYNNRYNLKEALKNPERFQILCSNCNVGKHRNRGVCPHENGSVPNWYVADLLYGA